MPRVKAWQFSAAMYALEKCCKQSTVDMKLMKTVRMINDHRRSKFSTSRAMATTIDSCSDRKVYRPNNGWVIDSGVAGNVRQGRA